MRDVAAEGYGGCNTTSTCGTLQNSGKIGSLHGENWLVFEELKATQWRRRVKHPPSRDLRGAQPPCSGNVLEIKTEESLFSCRKLF